MVCLIFPSIYRSVTKKELSVSKTEMERAAPWEAGYIHGKNILSEEEASKKSHEKSRIEKKKL